MVFDKATRISCSTFSRFRCFAFIVTSVENPASQRYTVANGIMAAIARFTSNMGRLLLKKTKTLQEFLNRNPILTRILFPNQLAHVWQG
ncbi:hypothetical protein TNCT_644631 [Trichonephila clavata]|uniref:Uncharacterized protein n=1 Tax=Trichonephila clavata TaxID=2740835 RepID=A0A8X6FXA7_TRICU|nr:hypothetical protein TNCT_644631 [Trichonephila clavata]